MIQVEEFERVYRLYRDLVFRHALRVVGRRDVAEETTGDAARAFFYAGAETIVATLWDVADEPSARLMPRFYEFVAGGARPADALRRAQLALLSDLRAGRVIVQGQRGSVPLPEHPSQWAGFVLLGNPE